MHAMSRRTVITGIVAAMLTAFVVLVAPAPQARAVWSPPAVTHVATNTAFTPGGSALSVGTTVPATAKPGDTLIIWASAERSLIPTIGGISGLTSIRSSTDTTIISVVAAHKTVTATDVGATVTSNVTSGRRMALAVSVYRHVGSIDVADAPWAVSSGTVGTPAVTPVRNNSVLVAALGQNTNNSPYTTTFTPGAGWTERADVTSNSPTMANPTTWIAEKAVTGGAGVSQSGATATATVSNQRYIASTIALGPMTEEERREGALLRGVDKPTSDNTGALPDVTRTRAPVSGCADVTLNTANTVYENKDVYGRISVNAQNVTIRNVWVHGCPTYSPSGDDHLIRAYGSGQAGLVLEHVTIAPDVPTPRMHGMAGHDFTARFVDCYHVVDCWQVYDSNDNNPIHTVDVTIDQSFCHDLSWWSGPSTSGGPTVPQVHNSDDETHNDCIQHQGGSNGVYRGNVLDARYAKQVGHWLTTNSTEPYQNVPLDPVNGPYRTIPERPSGGTEANGKYNWEDQATIMVNDRQKEISPDVWITVKSCDFTVTDNWLYGGVQSVNAGGNEPYVSGCELGTWHRNKFDHSQGHQNANTNDTSTLHFGGGTYAGHVDAGVGTVNQNVYEDTGVPVNVRGD